MAKRRSKGKAKENPINKKLKVDNDDALNDNNNNTDEIVKDSEYYFKKFAEKRIMNIILDEVYTNYNLSLVNKFFYNIVSKYEKGYYRAIVEQEHGLNAYKYYLNTKRICSEVHINNVNFAAIKSDRVEKIQNKSVGKLLSVIQKFSPNIKKLVFNKCVLTDDQLMRLIEPCKGEKLNELEILCTGIIHESIVELPPDMKFPNLHNLNFNLSKYGKIKSLPETNSNILLEFLQNIQKYSPNLKNLSASADILKLFDYNRFLYHSLSIQKGLPSKLRIADIISHQDELYSLDLMDCFIMDDVVKEILKLKYLRILKINLDGMSSKGFSDICKNTKIYELGIKLNHKNHEFLATISSTYMLKHVQRMTINIIGMTIHGGDLCSLLHIKLIHLHLITTQPLAVECVFLSLAGKTLQSCIIEIQNGQLSGNAIKSHRKMSSVTSLKDFKLINSNLDLAFCTTDLSNLLKRIPNIQKLHITGFTVNHDLHVSALKNHYELEELTLLEMQQDLCKYDFDGSAMSGLEEDIENLKFMEINCLSVNYTNPQFPIFFSRGNTMVYISR